MRVCAALRPVAALLDGHGLVAEGREINNSSLVLTVVLMGYETDEDGAGYRFGPVKVGEDGVARFSCDIEAHGDEVTLKAVRQLIASLKVAMMAKTAEAATAYQQWRSEQVDPAVEEARLVRGD